jgi:hypothetical protein
MIQRCYYFVGYKSRGSGPKVVAVFFFCGRPNFSKPSKLREKQTDGEQKEALLPGGTVGYPAQPGITWRNHRLPSPTRINLEKP